MRIKSLVWLGIPVGDYATAVQFFTQTLGLEVAFDEVGTVELSAGNDDRIQLFGPGHRYFEFYRSRGASIVPLFEVDNLDQARDALARGGAEILGEPESDRIWTWLTFRAPDGNIQSLGARQRQREAGQEQMAPSARSDLRQMGATAQGVLLTCLVIIYCASKAAQSWRPA